MYIIIYLIILLPKSKSLKALSFSLNLETVSVTSFYFPSSTLHTAFTVYLVLQVCI